MLSVFSMCSACIHWVFWPFSPVVATMGNGTFDHQSRPPYLGIPLCLSLPRLLRSLGAPAVDPAIDPVAFWGWELLQPWESSSQLSWSLPSPDRHPFAPAPFLLAIHLHPALSWHAFLMFCMKRPPEPFGINWFCSRLAGIGCSGLLVRFIQFIPSFLFFSLISFNRGHILIF